VASGVTLQLTRGTELDYGYREGPADYAFREITTPAEVVNVPSGSPSSAFTYFQNIRRIFFDLEDGPSYGGGPYPLDGSPSDVLSFPLNAAGVAGFNTARGDFFTVGGSGGGRGEYLADASFYRQPIFYGVSDPAKLVVTCALPRSKAECKEGGWKSYGVFKNQGDCVSFVATGGKNPPAGSP
jgi:hypothetical protein